ncbi:MAG: AAA family ATPase [Synechococcaceae cyanobacterium]|nr:AAA family ATPase [Synechococcaceae cyanobacterium]
MPSAEALRCHLLIGPPASGKSRFAELLTAQLLASGVEPVVLSTDRIREELFGEASVVGRWAELEAVLQERLLEAVRARQTVILDATHARRSWRLRWLQAQPWPVPIDWIGWWLKTPLPTCLAWNQQRDRQVDPPVLTRYHSLLHAGPFPPQRAEGFAALVELDPSQAEAFAKAFANAFAGLKRSIAGARAKHPRVLHGYSRLLDLERLLHLIRLLLRDPDLSGALSHLPDGREALVPHDAELAERAAALLQAELGACYADPQALRSDLAWLQANGFCSRLPVHAPIEPPPPGPLTLSHAGGWPPEADPAIFRRVMALLRHVIQDPFDSGPGSLRHYLAARLEQLVPQSYCSVDGDNLRKDVERILTPYGFRVTSHPSRGGYALGTAVLSASQLQELVQLLDGVVQQLSDPTKQDLLETVRQRLDRGGLPVSEAQPLRRIANRSIVHPGLLRSDCLAQEPEAKKLESAILCGQRIAIERYGSAASFAGSPEASRWVWPLQLIFHNIGWYLAFEEGLQAEEPGLIRTERLDRLKLLQVEPQRSRSLERRRQSLERLDRLLQASGGIYFGDDLAAQLAVAGPDLQPRQEVLQTLRFRCAPWMFAFLREGLQRFPQEVTRLSRPLPADTWWKHPEAPHLLEPLPQDSHPYPVEIDLPPWTLERDVDLRRWLFGFGAGVVIETPEALRLEHQRRGEAVAALYRDADGAAAHG